MTTIEAVGVVICGVAVCVALFETARVFARWRDTGNVFHSEEMISRIPMRHRYMPEAPDDARSMALADQILGDQEQLHEEPGARVVDPEVTPDKQVVPTLMATAGAYTFVGNAAGLALIREARPYGGYREYDVPEEWAEVISAFAFEVARLT